MYSRRVSVRRAFPVLLSAVIVSLGACSDGATVGPPLPESAIAAGNLKSYRLGVGDKVRLTVFGEPDLSGTFEINALGRIPLPLAGEIEAAGLDASTFQSAATRRLSDGFLKNPRVTVEVVGYRPIYVHGEVRTGGEFPFKTGMRLRDAVALAGGYTYRANHGYVLLSRTGNAHDARVRMPNDMLVMPGDNIRVPERYF
jgi:polysaccharide export outer membrane protein